MLLPYFEVDGQKYELRASRFVIKEYQKMQEGSSVTTEQKRTVMTLQKTTEELKEVTSKLKELKEAYYADMSNAQAKARYKACKEEYDELYEKMIELQTENDNMDSMMKKLVDTLEQVAIMAIAEQYFQYGVPGVNIVEAREKAANVWERFVDENGKSTATEWLMEMQDSLFTPKKDNNSFLARKRSK